MLEYFKKKLRVLYTLVDLIFIALAYMSVCRVFANLNVLESANIEHEIVCTVLVTSGLYFVCVYASGMYKSILKYIGIRDLAMVLFTCIISFVGTAVFSFILNKHILDEKIIVFSGFFALALMLFFRVISRWFYITKKKGINYKGDGKNLLIIGAGEATVRLLDELQMNRRGYNILGLIDDDSTRIGGSIRGVEVMGNRYDIEKLCKKFDVDEIFFSVPSMDTAERAKILKICADTGCRVRVLPNREDISVEKGIYGNIKNVEIEDLLERDSIELDISGIESYIKDKTVLVTGGGGSIGSELCRQIARFSPAKIIILDIYENNAYELEQEMKRNYPEANIEIIIASVRDKKRLESIFASSKPDIVFHAAAHKHVPLMERSPCEAVKNNVFGTYNCAMCAHEAGVGRFVLISTDKAVNPTNVMGATKRICEMIIQSINEISKTEFVAVRFGNVLGSNGSVVPLFKSQIESGGPVTLTHKEITRFFMTIPEAAQLVLQAGAFAEGGEIFVLDMGKPVRIYDLAVNLITLSGFVPGVDIPIKITGLRPGEKLYEELLMSEEGLADTKHEKIYTARPMHFEWAELIKKLEELEKCVKEDNAEKLRDMVKDIVPTFRKDDRDKDCEGKGENIDFLNV